MQLRKYELDTIEKTRTSIRAGNRRVIIQAPCGSGKTILAAHMTQQALKKNKTVIFLVHFRQLAYQALERFRAYGIGDSVGIIMANEKPHLDRPVQIISVQTYGRRLALAELTINKWFKKADLIFYDEAHASISKTRKAVLDLYKDTSVIIGLTATPCRSDGRPLGSIYEDIVSCSSIAELTELGYLVPMEYYGAKHSPNLKNIKTIAGDYCQKELGKRVDKAKLVGDILENWLRIAGDRQTVIFATSVKHSQHIKEQFLAHNISIEHIDAHTPEEERQVILKQFQHGDIQVITNCAVFSEGADFPWASCIILAKPTKSLARYIQMAGRGLRPWPDKENCILIDHAGTIYNHGFLDEEVAWTLAGKEIAWKKPKVVERERVVMHCEECRNLFYGNTCPRCGFKVKHYGKKILTAQAKLKKITRGKKQKKKEFTIADKRRFYGQLKHRRIIKNYHEGWLYNAYKKKFGIAPRNVQDVGPIEPDVAFNNYMTYLNIRYNAWRRKKK
jgi:superfamily II DNA or RNA helicase